jgi:(S)-ureidoglycine aminohydrolase
MSKAFAVVHIGPAGGARFTQYTAEFEAGGQLGPAVGQRFIYVLEGSAEIVLDSVTHWLRAGSFAYLPAGKTHSVGALEPARIAVIEKEYAAAAEFSAPAAFVAHEDDVRAAALNGDADLQVKMLIPDAPGHDFAVNTMTYEPGAALAQVEIHVMEHGLLMLAGGGIYRLGEAWYPVTAGDFIWMAPFCPQWFAAIGKTPAKYLIYKDWNRHPLAR